MQDVWQILKDNQDKKEDNNVLFNANIPIFKII